LVLYSKNLVLTLGRQVAPVASDKLRRISIETLGKSNQMANDSVIRALKTKSKSLNLSCRKITHLPEVFEKLPWISVLKLNNNYLSSLPSEIMCLQKVSSDTFVQ